MPMHDWTRVRAGTYHNFHYRWIAAMMDQLNAGLLPRGLFAMAEQVVGGPEPDVVTLKVETDVPFVDGQAGVAVATPPALPLAQTKPKTRFVMTAEQDLYARKVNRIKIQHELGEVLAIIELVSPGNKSSRAAIRSFVTKSVDLIGEGINLLIIDPFPPGPRDPNGVHDLIWQQIAGVGFELPDDRPLTMASYQVAPMRTAYVEPIAVGLPLPVMPLFLREDRYINLPLEDSYEETWGHLPVELKRPLE